MKLAVSNRDLNEIVESTTSLWPMLRNRAIFITGGTGFIGKWLLQTLAYANDRYDLRLSITVLTRSPFAFQQKYPHFFENKIFTFLQGDVRTFVFPDRHYDFIIHAATEASAALNREQPQLMLDTILQGTSRALAFAKKAQCQRFLFVSSGAVYGRQPYDIKQVSEYYFQQAERYESHSIYGVGKLAAEYLCTESGDDLHCSIARCYSFVGPYLPLDAHFAIGNFIRDGLSGNKISVNSDGTSVRSYMYATDLIIWLLHVMCLGEKGKAYNIGSDEPVSMAELAHLVAAMFSSSPRVDILHPSRENQYPDIYVPSVSRVKEELGLKMTVSLPEAIKRTIEWYHA